MLTELFTIILLGITAVAEYYLFGVEDIQAQHGLMFILEWSIAVVLPILCCAGIVMSVKKNLPHEAAEPEEAPKDNRSLKEIASQSLKSIAASKQPLAKECRKADEQIERFESRVETLSGLRGQNGKLSGILTGCKGIFYKRMNEFILLSASFDEKEYRMFKAGQLDLKEPELIKRKENIYKGILGGLDRITDDNEELILRLDEMLQAMNGKQSSTEWDAETLLTLDRIGEYIDRVNEDVKLDKDVNLSAANAIKGIYDINNINNKSEVLGK